MEESTGVVNHVLLAKFKDGITSQQIKELRKGYASLVNLPLVPFSIASSIWIVFSTSFYVLFDVRIENLHQGFTHVFESTFETVEGIGEYIAHPAHVKFADRFLYCLEKVVVVDYKPAKVVL